MLTPRLPWPLDDGGRIGMWLTVRAVASEYTTTLVSLVGPGEEHLPEPAAFTALGLELVRIPHRPAPLAALEGVVGRWPYTIARFRNRRLEVALREIALARRPRFALINHLHLAPYAESLVGIPILLREHNLEFRWLERFAEGLRNPLARAYARHQARRMRLTEAERCQAVDLVMAIQEEEARELRAIAPKARIEVVPVGIEFGRFLPHQPENPPIVLLTGSFGWPPNVEGAHTFLQTGWPRVRAGCPEARLRLVGKDLPAWLAAAARAAGAEPIGYVEAIEPEFARSSVVVVPLWVGAGARVKIVEAMAAGVPVVSTPLGAEGLELTPGTHVMIGEDASALGEAVAELLSSPARATALAAAGTAFARERFSLEVVGRQIVSLCREVSTRRLPDRYARADS